MDDEDEDTRERKMVVKERRGKDERMSGKVTGVVEKRKHSLSLFFFAHCLLEDRKDILHNSFINVRALGKETLYSSEIDHSLLKLGSTAAAVVPQKTKEKSEKSK